MQYKLYIRFEPYYNFERKIFFQASQIITTTVPLQFLISIKKKINTPCITLRQVYTYIKVLPFIIRLICANLHVSIKKCITERFLNALEA